MDNKKEIETIAEIAASWWSNVIDHPIMDNGTYNIKGLMSTVLMEMLVEPITEEQQFKFREDLKAVLIEKIYGLGRALETTILDVDYYPCKVLSDIAEANNISLSNFPIKTTMWISRNHIELRYGYGSPIEQLYANKTYFEERIKSCKEVINYYKERDDDYFVVGTRQELIEEQKKQIREYEQKLKEVS